MVYTSIRDASKLIGCAENQVHVFIARGQLRFRYEYKGARIVKKVRLDDVEAFAEEWKHKQVSKARKRRFVISGEHYIYRPLHPRSQRDGYIPERWAVMEAMLGRQLKPTESVYLADKDKNNLSPENVVLKDSAWVHVKVPEEFKTYLEKIRGYDEKEKRLLRLMKKLVED